MRKKKIKYGNKDPFAFFSLWYTSVIKLSEQNIVMDTYVKSIKLFQFKKHTLIAFESTSLVGS